MAKITKFGTISGSLEHLTFSGFEIDPEGDESISKSERFAEGSSTTFYPLKVAEVIITGTIEKLNKDLVGIREEMSKRYIIGDSPT